MGGRSAGQMEAGAGLETRCNLPVIYLNGPGIGFGNHQDVSFLEKRNQTGLRPHAPAGAGPDDNHIRHGVYKVQDIIHGQDDEQ